jgi:outer membrane protein OmpA-like peptidoglycan-associated protein
MIRSLALITLSALALPVFAADLSLPVNARQTVERDVVLGSYDVALGGFENGVIPARTIEGQINTQAWRIEGSDLTTLQILAPLRSQLTDAGFTILFDCASDACGGFDFRFATEVLPAPGMYVDISDYHFVAAVSGPIEALGEVITLLVSRSSTAGFVQIVHAGQRESVTVRPANGSSEFSPQNTTESAANLATKLIEQGHVILPGLSFNTGSSDLSNGKFASLESLAAYLTKNPDIKIALVGHTDSQGALSSNILLSKRRAQSVVERLVGDYAIPRWQMQAEGMGYLAPVASNLTQEGRDLNRRVEAILLFSE